jgi:hypothetical protein
MCSFCNESTTERIVMSNPPPGLAPAVIVIGPEG